MSYASLLKNIPDFLSQPAGIAAIASIGIHGVIAFLLPLMPVDSKPKQPTTLSKSKTVGLLELNSAERNRLPQTGIPQVSSKLPVPLQPQISLQPLAPSSNLTAQMPSVPPLPPASSLVTLPPLPKAPTNPSISSLPKGQSLRILPKRDFQINPSLSTNTATANRTTIAQSLPTVTEDREVKLGGSKLVVPANEPKEREVKPLRSKPIMPYNLPEVQAANMPADFSNTPSPAAIPSAPLYNSTVGQSQNQQVMPVGVTPQSGDKLALTGESLRQLQPQSIKRVPELPSTATDQVIGTNNIGDQFSQLKRQYPNIETKRTISETVNAKTGQTGRVEGALVVNSDGMVDSINFLDNSASSDLKTAARQYFRDYFQNHPARANGKPKYYPFNLSFRSNSSNTLEVIKEPSFSNRTHQTQTSSDSPQIITPRLPLNQVNPQPSNNAQQANVRSELHSPITQSSQMPTQNRSSQAITVKPLPELRIRKNESTPAPLEQATTKPVTERIRKNESTPAPLEQATEKPSTGAQISSNLPLSPNAKQKLIKQLRELREQRQISDQEAK